MCSIVPTPSAPASPSGWWEPNWPWAVGNGHTCSACGQWVLNGSYHCCPGASGVSGVMTTSWGWCSKHGAYAATAGCGRCAAECLTLATAGDMKRCPECWARYILPDLPRCATCDWLRQSAAAGPNFAC